MGNSEETFHAGIFFSLSPRAVFSLSLSQTGQPHSPLCLYSSFHYIHLSFELKCYTPATLFGFSNVARLCRLLCLQPLEHTAKICQSLIRGAFSLSRCPPKPPAQPCSLTAQDLFVFSHGLMSQTQVSLIINDPRVVGPLRPLRSLTWLTDQAAVCGCFLSFSR